MQLQSMTVQGDSIELTLADNVDLDAAKSYILARLSAPDDPGAHPLSWWRISALKRVRELLDSEIYRLEKAAEAKSSTKR